MKIWIKVAFCLVCASAALFVLSLVVRWGLQFHERQQVRLRLEQLGLAFNNYRDTYRAFPPSAVYDENGTPMHSWRVLVLPYIQANAFTDHYDRSSPWNGPANKDLMDGSRHTSDDKFPYPAKVRSVYQRNPGEPQPDDLTTNYLMIVEDTRTPLRGFLRGRGWLARPSQLHGVITIIVVTSSNVHWMEPQDVSLNPPHGGLLPFDSVASDVIASMEIGPDGGVQCYDREEALRRLARRVSS